MLSQIKMSPWACSYLFCYIIYMTKVLLIRHAESTANKGDVAFGNFEAPLTDNALNNQIPNARKELIEKYGINPDEYSRPVAVSEYYRTYQTAKELGFRAIDEIEVFNESEIYQSDELASLDVIKKHVDDDGWLPEQELVRARQIIENIKNGTFDYEIIFSHGMVIAGILSELNRLGFMAIEPDNKRGYVPLQSQIIQIEI